MSWDGNGSPTDDGGVLEDQLRRSLRETSGGAVTLHVGPHLVRNGPPLETRITDPVTGGQKGSKPAQLGAMDPAALMQVATVAGFGAGKYDTWNFVKGFKWSLSYNALQRHLHAFWDGEANDPESGLPHLAHAAWHCLALLTFTMRGRGTDDRIRSVL
jgi:hypothetical protein